MRGDTYPIEADQPGGGFLVDPFSVLSQLRDDDEIEVEFKYGIVSTILSSDDPTSELVRATDWPL